MKIYYIASRFPYPLIKGDKLRAYHQIKELSKNNEIYLAALSDTAVPKACFDALRPFCKEIRVFRLSYFSIFFHFFWTLLFSRKPMQVGYFYNRKVAIRIKKDLTRIGPDHVFCQLIRTAEYMAGKTEIKKTLDYMDALSAGMERRAEHANVLLKPILRIEARRLKKYEHTILAEFDHACIISNTDRNLIFHFENEAIAIVPNGIDSNYFKPDNTNKEFDLLFTGNMSYPPNVRSVKYLVEEIMPLVWQKRPKTTLLISGANPVNTVKKLQSDKIKVEGWTEDIRTSYRKSSIFIAPMLIGSGLQNKLLEAMIMELPCITSALANRSLGAEEGAQILVGRSEREYLNHLMYLLENPKEASALAKKGHSFVHENFNWTRSNEILNNLMLHGKAQGSN